MEESIRQALSAWLAWELPTWVIPNQTNLVALGFLAGAIAAVALARRAGLPMRHVALGLTACFVGAVVGSRLAGLLLQAPTLVVDPGLALRKAGSVSFGALLGGCLAFWLYTRRRGLDPWHFADVMAPAAGLGLCFARLGCFVHGCDFGRITTSGVGVRYPVDSIPYQAHIDAGFIGRYQLESLPVHPYQLYLAGFDLALFAVFVAWSGPRGRAPGERALLVGAAYFSGRFCLEFLRAPAASPLWGLLNVSQWMCLSALALLALMHRRVGVPADAAELPAR